MGHPDLFLLRPREWNDKDKKLFTDIRVEDVRRATHTFQQAGGRGGYRVCILDSRKTVNQNSANALAEAHRGAAAAFPFSYRRATAGPAMATLRSRCQKILLRPLAAADIGAIVAALGPPWSNIDDAARAAAVARSRGSVHHALRLLGDQGIELDADWPDAGRFASHYWSQVHALADRSRHATTAAITRRCSPRSRTGSMHGCGSARGPCKAPAHVEARTLPLDGTEPGGARDRNLQSLTSGLLFVPFRRSGGGGTGFSFSDFLTRSPEQQPSCGALYSNT